MEEKSRAPMATPIVLMLDLGAKPAAALPDSVEVSELEELEPVLVPEASEVLELLSSSSLSSSSSLLITLAWAVAGTEASLVLVVFLLPLQKTPSQGAPLSKRHFWSSTMVWSRATQ